MSNGRANRAAQFNPFDALKGLQEALRKKEEISSRVEKRELSEEQQEALSSSLMRINQGTNVDITFFNKGHYISFIGIVASLDSVCRYMLVNQVKIYFDDIYKIKII